MSDKEEKKKISLVGAELQCQQKGCHEFAISLSDYCWKHTEDKDWYKTKVEEHTRKTKSLRRYYMKEADLVGVNLQGVELWEANLQGADLQVARLQGANFAQTKLQGAYLVGANLEGANFARAELEGIHLLGANLKDVSLLTAVQFGSGIGEETDRRFKHAREVYISLKNHFHTVGRYGDERWAFLKEREMERRLLFVVAFYRKEPLLAELTQSRRKRFCRWLRYSPHWREAIQYYYSEIANLLCGYCERPLRVFTSALAVIALFAIFYYGSGQIWLAEDLAEKMGGVVPRPSLLDSLYFSVVTFTTLGFGDWRPNPASWVRYLVMLEAFAGAFMMALFVFTFGKSVARR